MKKLYKCLFIYLFVISFFIFIDNVQASYKATVLNPSGAKCDLHKESTGYCYYKDKNLNSYVDSIIWLDTGDEVTILENEKNPNIKSNNTNICSDEYVYTSFNYNNSTYYGYYCKSYLTTGNDKLTEELKKEFKDAGFPESYWLKLSILKSAHPNWAFKAINTGLKFDDVVTNQTYGSKSLLRKSMSNNYAYLSLADDAFDYKNDNFIPYDDKTGKDPWYKANYDAIAYYVDPRNFLSDMYLFQFETLSYDESIPDDRLKQSINSIFENDYLSKFTDSFLEAGKISKVNPIYLASLSKEEVSNGATAGTAINGTYNKMYNFYNIGAYSDANPVYNGLNFAALTDEATLRPWSTEQLAITGGAIWIYNNYIYTGQDTSYFKKYNVIYNYLVSIDRTPTYNNYGHQYMQNIAAPSSEAITTYKSYNKNNMLDLSYTFYIPIYENMPESTKLPTKGGWPNNYLKVISINKTDIIGFDGEVENYNYNLDINDPVITLSATPVNSSAKVEGTGTFEITENTTKTIKVTAQNGDVKTYNIKITLTGTKLEKPIDIATTLNNSGIKNNDKYIHGFNVGSDISIIKEKIVNANKVAVVTLNDSSGKEKNSGVVATGDSVTITVGNETKTYEVVIYGDVTGDGKISAADYLKIKNTIMGTATLSGPYKEAADVDKNGSFKASDYLRIKDSIMGITTIEQ